jgi:hypothetical protein
MTDDTRQGANDTYAGLQEMARLCWIYHGRAIQAYYREDLKTYGGGQSMSILDLLQWLLNGVLDRLNADYIAWWLYHQVAYPFLALMNEIFLHPVQNIINQLPRSLSELLSGPLGALGRIVRDPISSLIAPLWEIPGTIAGRMWEVGYNFIFGPLERLGLNLSGLSNLPAMFLEGVTSLVGVLFNLPLEIVNGILGAGRTIGDALFAPISYLGDLLGIPISNLVSGVLGFFTNLPYNIPYWISVALSEIWTWLNAFWTRVYGRIGNTISTLIDQHLPAARVFVEGLWGGVASIPAQFVGWVTSNAGTDLAMQPARAMTTVASLYMMAIAAGTTAHLISTALNLLPTLNFVGAAQFAGLASEVAGFDRITDAVYGTLINDVLAVPLRYHYNAQIRPKLPTEGEIFTMGRKHGISYGVFKQSMAYHGIPDWWIDVMYDFFWTDPSPMWLLRMTEDGIPNISNPGRKREWLNQWVPGWQGDSLAWLKMKLLLAGYEDVDIGPMIEGMQKRYMKSATTQIKTSVRAMVRKGYWTEGDVRRALTPYGVREEEIQAIVIAEDLDYLANYLDDEVMYYKESFRKGQISGQDLRLALSSIFVKEDRVAQEVAREEIRALPKPKAVTPIEKDPLINRLRNQAADSWIKGYRAWEISIEDLRLGLMIVLQDAALADGMIAAELTRRREPQPTPALPAEDPLVAASRRQAIATWISAYRNGEIDADSLEMYLSALVPDETTRRQVVELEKLRYAPTPDIIPPADEDDETARIRAEYVRGHLALFGTRAISIDELYSYLLADGLAEPLARATAITQASKRIAPPSTASAYYLQDTIRDLIEQGLGRYESLYLAGEISLDTLRAWVGTLVADPVVVTYVVDQADLKRFSKSL